MIVPQKIKFAHSYTSLTKHNDLIFDSFVYLDL